MKDLGFLETKSSLDAVNLYNFLPDKSNTTLMEGMRTIEALGHVQKHEKLLDIVIKEEKTW